jgi:FixJ family two-component response regulator
LVDPGASPRRCCFEAKVVFLDEMTVSTLCPRERQMVAALIAGDDTRAMTERLVISRHTVQDHMKSVFAKVRRLPPARGSRPLQRRQ